MKQSQVTKNLSTAHSKGIFRGAFLFAAFSVIQPVTAYANIINDTYGAGAGSFELGNFVANVPPDAMGLAVGSKTITGWTVGGPGDGVDWIKTPTYGAMNGLYSVDLVHQTSSSIATAIPTISGAVYDLSFGVASVLNQFNTGLVTAGSLVNQSFTTTRSGSFATQTFDPFSYQFTAAGTSTTITFFGTNQNGGTTYGPVMDNVSVNYVSGPTSSIPEPSSLALMLIGLGAAITRKPQKQRKAK